MADREIVVRKPRSSKQWLFDYNKKKKSLHGKTFSKNVSSWKFRVLKKRPAQPKQKMEKTCSAKSTSPFWKNALKKGTGGTKQSFFLPVPKSLRGMYPIFI